MEFSKLCSTTGLHMDRILNLTKGGGGGGTVQSRSRKEERHMHMEIEFRFRIDGLVGMPIMFQGIAKEDEDYKLCVLESTRDDVVEIMDGGVRYITGSCQTKDNREEVFQAQMKKNLYSQIFVVGGGDIAVKLSLSTETEVNPYLPDFRCGERKSVRRRLRRSYRYVCGALVEVTIVDNASVEIEIEYPSLNEERNMEVLLRLNQRLYSYHRCMQSYSSLVGTGYGKLALSHPVDVCEENIEEVLSGGAGGASTMYGFTNKLDGERAVVYVPKIGLLPRPTMFVIFRNRIRVYTVHDQYMFHDIEETILDCEWMESEREMWTFDLLMGKGRDYRRSPFKDRYFLLKKFTLLLSTMTSVRQHMAIYRKLYSYPDYGGDNRHLHFIDSLMHVKYDSRPTDGLIIVSSGPKSNYYSHSFKLKEPSKYSIDFAIHRSAHEDCVELYLQQKGAVVKVPEVMNSLVTKKAIASVFRDDEWSYGDVFECTYDASADVFVPYRLRKDKHLPNTVFTAHGVWSAMRCPIPLEHFENLLRQRAVWTRNQYHNMVKKFMIRRYCSGKRVLDIGSGMGGDLWKYMYSDSQIVCLDNNSENLDKLKKRLVDNRKHSAIYPTSFRCNVLPTLSGIDHIEICKHLPSLNDGLPTVDVVCMFFSLSFFAEGVEMLQSLVDTWKKVLPVGGFVIGICMNGHSVLKAFDPGCNRIAYSNDDGTTYMSIELLSPPPTSDTKEHQVDDGTLASSSSPPPPSSPSSPSSPSPRNSVSGKTVRIQIPESKTSVDHEEYLVSLPVFQEVIQHNGFVMRESFALDPESEDAGDDSSRILYHFQNIQMSLPHIRSSALYDTFVIERVQLSPLVV